MTRPKPDAIFSELQPCMSFSDSKRIVAGFLDDKAPGVLCVKGQSGIGKTHAWQNARFGEESTQYTYISLFGIESLTQLKTEIISRFFTHSLDQKKAGNFNSSKYIIDTLARRFSGVNLGDLLTSSLFSSIRNRKLCLDDLERAGDDLSMRDVLGLVCHLRNEKDCKIVLLVNDAALAPKNARDFSIHLEKAADQIVSFVQKPVESAKIALDSAHTPQNAKLSSYIRGLITAQCQNFQINNIRTIRRIGWHVRDFLEAAKTHAGFKEQDIAANTVPIIVLTAKCKYELARTFSPEMFGDLSVSQQIERTIKAEQDRLDAQAGFGMSSEQTHDFALYVWESLDNGWFDQEALNPLIAALSDGKLLPQKAETETEAETEAETETETEAETDTEAETETEANTEAEADTESGASIYEKIWQELDAELELNDDSDLESDDELDRASDDITGLEKTQHAKKPEGTMA